MTTTTFTLTRADFAGLQKAVNRRFRRRAPLAFGLLVLMPIVGGICMGWAWGTLNGIGEVYPELSSLAGTGGALLAVAFVLSIAHRFITRALTARYMFVPDGEFLSPHTVSFSEEALAVHTARARSEIAWSGLIGRMDDAANHYLFIDGSQAVVLPRTALGLFAGDFERLTGHLQ